MKVNEVTCACRSLHMIFKVNPHNQTKVGNFLFLLLLAYRVQIKAATYVSHKWE